jgi:hypothetical protein
MCKGGREIERARARKRRERECKGKERGREDTFCEREIEIDERDGVRERREKRER